MKLLALYLLVGGPFAAHLAAAQADTTGLPSWTDVVPELVNGGGRQGIMMAIHQRLIYPPEARMVGLAGRVFVKFTITPAGEVKQVMVVKPLWAPFDSAAVAAVQWLPPFKHWPSQYGNMQYVVSVDSQIGEDSRAAKKARRRNSTP